MKKPTKTHAQLRMNMMKNSEYAIVPEPVSKEINKAKVKKKSFWDKVIDNPKTNNSIEYLEISDKWRKRNDEIYDYRNKMKNEAFKLFSEYFWSLWD